jgi:hypothetical protein
MAHELPDEIIDLILSYAPDFHDNLLSCHKEMLTDHRPIYYKKVVAGFTRGNHEPGIADSSNWDNFKRNDEIRIWRRGTHNFGGPMVFMKLKLRAIEITPEREVYGGEEEQGRWWYSRDIILYYGWVNIRNKYFWNTVCEWNQYNNELCPGYY